MSGALPSFFRIRNDGLDLFVRLTPKGGADRIEGLQVAGDTAHLKVRVGAIPKKGAANAALERLVAACLKVPKSSVAVVAGATSRLKTVRVSGDLEELSRKLARLAERSSP